MKLIYTFPVYDNQHTPLGIHKLRNRGQNNKVLAEKMQIWHAWIIISCSVTQPLLG